VVKDLSELGRAFALLDGFAVSARVEPRTTKDIDLAVVVEGDDDAEQLAFLLSQRGYVVETTVEHTHSGRLATIRMTSPSSAVVDLLFASSRIEPEAVRAATKLEILDGLTVPVASVGHVIAMKVLAATIVIGRKTGLTSPVSSVLQQKTTSLPREARSS